MKGLSDAELVTVTGGAMRPSASGVIQSEPNRGGGVTVDWNGVNQRTQNRAPTDGVFPMNGSDGSNGNGGWAIG